MLKDGTLLYHGSYAPIEQIDLSLCAGGKDFGKGFYLTEDFNQARNFIKNSIIKAKNIGIVPKDRNYGYVTVFRYTEPKEVLSIYQFNTADKEWLWFVSLNRRTQLASGFQKKLDQRLLDAEVVIGKIANDTTNPTIMAYLNGLYGDVTSDSATNFAISQLLPDRLKNQYCFLNERAISSLKLVEVKRYDV